jgi:Ca2+/Na+ antiporter
MGIFSDMFGDKPERDTPRKPELLAAGEYVYSGAQVIAGYKIFRRRFVIMRTVLFLVLSVLALTSSVMMIMSDGLTMLSMICTVVSAMVAFWFIKTPVENARQAKKAAAELEGEHYSAEITTTAIKITLLEANGASADIANEKNTDGASTENAKSNGASVDSVNTDNANAANSDSANESAPPLEVNEGTPQSDEPYEAPATLIHLDQFIVNIIETADTYVIVVAKKYVFVIPKSAFSDNENARVRERLSEIMESRYKTK